MMCDSYKLKLRFRRCDDQHVAVSIMVRGKQIKLCAKCWNKLADMDVEWGNFGIRKWSSKDGN